mgnify:FL=1
MMKFFNFKGIAIVMLFITFITSLCLAFYLTKRKLYNANDLLKEVKTYFRNVKGSYIVHQPIVLNNVNHNQPIYQGGITAYHDGKLVDYEFYADANSGQVIDIIEL